LLKIRDTNLALQTYVTDYWRDVIHEGINREFVFSFSMVIDGDKSQYIVCDNVVEVEDNYFKIVYVKKKRNQDGALTIDVDTEHVAQLELNLPEYDLQTFAVDDTPTNILAEILSGTNFTVGAVDFTNAATFSIQEKSSRRAILIQFAEYLGGELKFDKYGISLLTKRGNDNGVQFRVGKNLKGITVHQDKRSGTLEVAYDVNVVELSTLPEYGALEAINLGDDILVADPDLGVNEKQRIIEYDYSPKLKMNSKVTIANFIDGIEDTISRIERTTIFKEKLYNGIRIGPVNGFEATRSDEKARTIMNATDGIKLQKGDGAGVYVDVIFLDTEGNAVFKGTIEASDFVGGTINIGSGTFTVDNLGNMIANSGTFKGTLDGVDGSFVGTLSSPFVRVTRGDFNDVGQGIVAIDVGVFNPSTGKFDFDGYVYMQSRSSGASGTVDFGKLAADGITKSKLTSMVFEVFNTYFRGDVIVDNNLSVAGDISTIGDISEGGTVLSSKYAAIGHGHTTNPAGSHNHGIPDGTVLQKADGGTVTYFAIGDHTHTV